VQPTPLARAGAGRDFRSQTAAFSCHPAGRSRRRHQVAHSTARRRTSAVCWCCLVPALASFQAAASGAANGDRWVGTHINSRFAPERGRTIRFGTRAWVRHGTIRVNGTTPGSVFRAGFRNAHAPPDHAYQVSAYRFRMPRSAQKGTCAP
jgi:hypothetical protein